MERLPGMTRSLRTHVLAAFTALAMSAGILTATGSPAAAESAEGPFCNYDNSTFNACMTLIRPTPFTRWVNLIAGLDAFMDQGRAQEIVDRCGGQIEATLWYGNQPKRSLVPSAGWPSAGSTGIGLELHTDVVPDEDLNHGNVSVTIGYFDCLEGLNGVWVHYRTGTV